jgi:hypothetical protein
VQSKEPRQVHTFVLLTVANLIWLHVQLNSSKIDFMLGSPAQRSKGSTPLASGIVEKLTLAPCAIAHKIDFMHDSAAQGAK